MTKMWEYNEVDSNVSDEWNPRWEPEEGRVKQRLFRLNMTGAKGWELVAVRYVPVQPDEDGNPRGRLYETYKREIASGISREEREQELLDTYTTLGSEKMMESA